MPQTADVIVIGLGAMGSAALYQLSKRKVKALGIDRYQPPHIWGSTCGESRITRKAIGEGAEYVPLVLRSYEIWEELEALSSEKMLHQVGSLILQSDRQKKHYRRDNFLQITIDCARQFGIRHELLDAEEIRRQFPQFNVSDQERGYYEYDAGYLVPEKCVATQLELAQTNGAQARFNETVLALEQQGDSVRVKTDQGDYSAAKVIIAAGAWVHSFLSPELRQHFTLTRQVMYWLETPSIDKFLPPHFPVFIWQIKQDYSVYGMPAMGGSADGIKVATERDVPSASPAAIERTVSEAEFQRLYDHFIDGYFPDLLPRMVKAMTCIYTNTPDFRFVIDFLPDNDNIILASPCSGHGFKHSAAIGQIVSELALEGETDFDLSRFRVGRFL